ncbi:hypothetical protein AB0I28_33285 [Phytomonospora sp. NPDC050363]|uniref:hypothetical protein n=1 Tax=Phytomonospora sp. NPDC050363 TaxID=3155642 RepID=UPI0033EA0995
MLTTAAPPRHVPLHRFSAVACGGRSRSTSSPTTRTPPYLEVRRVPPLSHTWLIGAGALLGALAGAAAMAAFIRHRRSHPPTDASQAGVWGPAALCVNFALAAILVYSDLLHFGRIDEPLWRSARFIPFGASMNVGLVLLAASAAVLWRQRGKAALPSPSSST